MNEGRIEVGRRRLVYDGRIFSVSVDYVTLPGGRGVDMEVVRHPGSVILLPMPDPAHVILVRQYRYAIDRWLWELPAGSLRPGEEPEAAARRECHEEVGKLPRRLEHLGTFFPTPGFCSEAMIFYRISGLDDPPTRVALDEDELLEPRTFAMAEARALVASGEIVDMKTALGLTLV